MFDVIVVGAGPAGSVAAKRCAENGLSTLVIEKATLPRDKVCSGLVAPVTRTLLTKEFGLIPESVFAEPSSILGSMIHVPGLGSQAALLDQGLTWRRNLDYWMNQEARAKGVDIWDDARVTGLVLEKSGFSVTVERSGQKLGVKSRYLVGADGATSIIRTLLFPGMKVTYQQAYEEVYEGEIESLDKRYYHSFRSLEDAFMRFGLHQKDGFVVLVVAGRQGDSMKTLMANARDFLAKDHGFDVKQAPYSSAGCVEPMIYRELISRQFLPAKGDALLVGDAAGLINPVVGEGISVGVKSATAAADAIVSASRTGVKADEPYLAGIEGIISLFAETFPLGGKIAEHVARGGTLLLPAWAEVIGSVLSITESRLSA